LAGVWRARSDTELAQARALFDEYAEMLEAYYGLSRCLTGFDAEMADFPDGYEAVLLTGPDGAPSGCAGLYDRGGKVCELRRMYLRPEARGHGAGASLLESVLAEARAAGCREIVLETDARLEAAVHLYRRHGFTESETRPGELTMRRAL